MFILENCRAIISSATWCVDHDTFSDRPRQGHTQALHLPANTNVQIYKAIICYALLQLVQRKTGTVDSAVQTIRCRIEKLRNSLRCVLKRGGTNINEQ